MGRRTGIDWEAVERDFRAGQLTRRQLADLHKVAVSSITRKADALGWKQNLSTQVQTRTAAKLLEAHASGAQAGTESPGKCSQQSAQQYVDCPPIDLVTPATPDPEDAIERAASANVAVILRHRVDIASLRQLFQLLLGEVHAGTSGTGRALIDELQAMVQAEGAKTQEEGTRRHAAARAALNRVLTGPTRVDSATKLAAMLERLIKLERQAFRLEDDLAEAPGVEHAAEAAENSLSLLKARFAAVDASYAAQLGA